jgi:arylsulfatase A-like enzyme
MNNIFTISGAFILICMLLLSSCTTDKEKPNFVFIVVEDLGWCDLGYSGSSFHETPNIDELSKHSIQFTNAYSAASVCSPSRAAIMTGKHPVKVNITDWIPGQTPKDQKLFSTKDLDELPLENKTIAEVLQENGYQTFFAGKWHLGDLGFFPEDQGFDINIGGHHMGQPPGGYYSPYKNPKLNDGPDGEYLTDRLCDESISFLDTVGERPFFLFLSFYTVHTPIQASKRHLEHFTEKLSKLGNPEIQVKIEGKGTTVLNQANPAYASMVYAMDENVGRLIQKLKELDLYENTTIIFTSDNGGLSTNKTSYNSIAPTSVTPLRGGKGWLYEGGIRVPLLIKPHSYDLKPRTSSVPVVGYDLFPTLITMAGLNFEEEIDGVDLSGIIAGEKSLDRTTLYWHYPHYHGSGWTPGAAIRMGDWKLIKFYETGVIELLNLSDDVSESSDLSSKYPKKVIAMSHTLDSLQRAMNARLPEVNESYVD